MAPYIFGALVAVSIAHLAIGLFVLVKNPRSQVNRVFAGFTAVTSLWIISNYYIDHSSYPIELSYITFSAASVAATLLLTYALLTARPVEPKLAKFIPYVLIVGTIVSVLGGTRFVVAGGQSVGGIVNIAFGPLGSLYFGYLILAFGSVAAALLRAFMLSKGAERSKIRFIMISIGASLILAVVTNLFAPLIFQDFRFVAIGPLGTILLASGISYTIIRHRLFDIKLVVARSFAFAVLIASVGFIYTGLLIGFSGLIFDSAIPSRQEAFIEGAMALTLAFTFQPLRRFFERITNKIFYRDHYDSQEVLNNFSKILVSELDLDRILKRSLETLTQSVHIQYAQLVIFNNERVYRIDHVGPVPRRMMVAPEMARLNKPMIIADELEGGERKALLEEHGIRMSIMLRTSEEFVGYLLLGDKLSGDIYSTQDIKLLEIIGKELAVAILNAKSYAEIQAFNVNLQARVDHATNRLRVANRHLKELDHAKDEFISMASHQLRTPLTTIKGYLSMMQEGDAGQLTHAQKDFVGYAFGASERMVNLISDLLNVSRLSAGRFLIQAKPTDMVQMVADEVRQLQTHALAKSIELIFTKPDADFPIVELDDNKTRQVIMNFIDNAIYYTQEGSVQVVLERADAGHVRLEVRDSGIGVPKAAQRKLFSKFFRAENAQIVRPDGTGLGLYLAKRVIEDQGGIILFSSVEGKGSTFGFELPIKHVAPIITGKRHGHK